MTLVVNQTATNLEFTLGITVTEKANLSMIQFVIILL